MVLAISSQSFIPSISPRTEVRARNVNSSGLKSNSSFQIVSQMESSNGSGKRVWRRRKLTKKDDLIRYKMQRVPFLEEKARKIREEQKHVSTDLHRLLLSEDNRYDFVNEIAEEATALVESNIDEYGGKKKAVLQALGERMTDLTGVDRSDAYNEPEIGRPGPDFVKEIPT